MSEPTPDDDDHDDEDLPPRVAVGTVADLGDRVPPALAKAHGERPVWFMHRDDRDEVGLFDRLPEGPFDKDASRGLLAALRTFADDQNADLQTVLGPTDALEFGFHATASLDDVVESFEDDGFDVSFALEDGEVVDDGEDGEDDEG